jgi:hypothetical protein
MQDTSIIQIEVFSKKQLRKAKLRSEEKKLKRALSFRFEVSSSFSINLHDSNTPNTLLQKISFLL